MFFTISQFTPQHFCYKIPFDFAAKTFLLRILEYEYLGPNTYPVFLDAVRMHKNFRIFDKFRYINLKCTKTKKHSFLIKTKKMIE